jgi:hypothetical protein
MHQGSSPYRDNLTPIGQTALDAGRFEGRKRVLRVRICTTRHSFEGDLLEMYMALVLDRIEGLTQYKRVGVG